MEISDFYISQAIFEVRYAHAYKLWDCAGSVTEDVLTAFPGSKVTDANPARVTFQLSPKALASIELEKTSVTAVRCKHDLEELQLAAVKVYGLAEESLEWRNLIRVSTRVIYAKDLKTIPEGALLTLKTGVIRLPQKNLFDHKDDPMGVDFAFRWEDDGMGTIVKMRTENVTVEFANPDFPEIEEIKKSRARFILDIDRFSENIGDPGKFRIQEWIRSYIHLVNRDVQAFIKPI